MPGWYFKNSFKLWKTNNSHNDSKQRKGRLALSYSKELSALLRGINSKHNGGSY